VKKYTPPFQVLKREIFNKALEIGSGNVISGFIILIFSFLMSIFG
jgi:hypothetical protein